MMKKAFGIIAVWLICAASASADPLQLPGSFRSGTFTTEAVERASGKRLWSESQSMFTGVEHGKKFLLISVKGGGRFGGADAWEITSYYYLEPQVRPYYTKKRFFSQHGDLLKSDTFYYDSDNRKIRFQSEEGKGGKTTIKLLDMADDLVDYFVLIPAVTGLDFSRRREFKFNFISADPKIYSFTVRLIGSETLKIAGKTIACDKLELTPELGALSLLEGLFPKSTFWISRGAVREFVRYEGLESGIGSPFIRLQLVGGPSAID